MPVLQTCLSEALQPTRLSTVSLACSPIPNASRCLFSKGQLPEEDLITSSLANILLRTLDGKEEDE